MTTPEADLRRRLSHVLWIGGAPDAGKTSVATAIARQHGLHLYVFDQHERAHIARADPARHPSLYRLRQLGTEVESRAALDARWVQRTPEVMAARTVASWTERCAMVVEDLLALPTDPPVLAEGPGLFPECVAPLISDARQAIWLAPTEAFKLASAARRGKPSFQHQTSDPARAWHNWFQRDLLLAEHVQRQAREHGLTVLEVDGTHSINEMATLVTAHFGPRLRP